MHPATSKVENSAKGLSCQLKFAHGWGMCSLIKLEECRWESSERIILFSCERDVHYPNFEDIYYLELGSIILVGGLSKA